jgi:hypothetical protein
MRREEQDIYTEFWWEDLSRMYLLADEEIDEGLRR